MSKQVKLWYITLNLPWARNMWVFQRNTRAKIQPHIPHLAFPVIAFLVFPWVWIIPLTLPLVRGLWHSEKLESVPSADVEVCEKRVKCALRFTAFTRRFSFTPHAGEFSSESATFPVALLSCLMAFWKPSSAHLALNKTIPSNQKDQVSVHCSKMNAHPFAKRELLFCVPRRLMMVQYWFQLSINTFECTGFNLSA